MTTFAIKDIKLVKREVYNFKKVNGKWKERITTSRLKSFKKGNKKTIEKEENKKKVLKQFYKTRVEMRD